MHLGPAVSAPAQYVCSICIILVSSFCDTAIFISSRCFLCSVGIQLTAAVTSVHLVVTDML